MKMDTALSPSVTLLGTGSPIPDPRRHGPATLLQVGGRPLLFDAGRGVVLQLLRAGVSLAEVDTVFITHHHYNPISSCSGGKRSTTGPLRSSLDGLGSSSPWNTSEASTAFKLASRAGNICTVASSIQSNSKSP